MKKNEEFEKVDPQKYNKSSFLSKMPSWLKILLLKYWAAGAAFFFFGMGSGFIWYNENNPNNSLYLFVLLCLGYALISEYIVKQVVRLLRTSRDDTYYYNMINIKGTVSFFLNLGYSVLVVTPTFFFFGWLGNLGFNQTIWGVHGIEPFTFALGVTFVDFVYMFIKNTIANYLKKRKFVKAEATKDKEL